MTPEEFNNIKSKIDRAKTQKAQAEGALDQLMTQLKTDFGLATIEEAKTKSEELAKEIKVAKDQLESLFKELEAVTDWNAI